MAYSAAVTGWTERRLPFWVTIIFSRPGVLLSVARDSVPGKRSTKPMSTAYQTGNDGVERASKPASPFLQALGSG